MNSTPSSAIRVCRRFRRRARGDGMVEFAIVSMFFFTVFFGIIELARVTVEYGSLANAAREGARTAAVDTSDSDVRSSALKAVVAVGAAPAVTINNYSVDTSLVAASQTLTPIPAGTPRTSGNIVQVTVSHTFTPIFPFPISIPMSAQARMGVE